MELEDRKYSNFKGMSFDGENFSNADLSYSNFVGANLLNCNFTGSIIDFCNFKQANVTGSDFTGAMGAYVPWIDTGMPEDHRVSEGVPLEDESAVKSSSTKRSVSKSIGSISAIDRCTDRVDKENEIEDDNYTDTKGVEDGSDSIK